MHKVKLQKVKNCSKNLSASPTQMEKNLIIQEALKKDKTFSLF